MTKLFYETAFTIINWLDDITHASSKSYIRSLGGKLCIKVNNLQG